jgi:type II secretory pathway pseudopilin PulG
MKPHPYPHTGRGAGGRQADDAGITMVELIVGAALAALFLGLMVSIFVTGMRTEASVRERDAATGQAQVITESIQASVRNADAFTIDGAVLRARVATGASDWECRAWALTPAGELRYTASDTATGTDPTAWAVLATGVTGTEPGGVPFTQDGSALRLGISVTAGDATVPVTAGAAAQALAEGAVTPCW